MQIPDARFLHVFYLSYVFYASYPKRCKTQQGCKTARGCKFRVHVRKHAPNVGYVTDVCGDAKWRMHGLTTWRTFGTCFTSRGCKMACGCKTRMHEWYVFYALCAWKALCTPHKTVDAKGKVDAKGGCTFATLCARKNRY